MANLVMDGVTLASKSGSDVTIQDTNVNFPAGHIIQISQNQFNTRTVSYTHLTLPTNREV